MHMHPIQDMKEIVDAFKETLIALGAAMLLALPAGILCAALYGLDQLLFK